MAIKDKSSGHFNEQQMLMLRLLKIPLPEQDFIQIQRLVVSLLSKQLDQLTERWELNEDITSETYEKLAQGHFRVKP